MEGAERLRFEAQLTDHFGLEVAQRVIGAIQEEPSVSLRLNPMKPARIPDGSSQVPWHPHGYILPERPVFALDPMFHAGAYYVQDSSSMILSQIIKTLELPAHPLCLDACAAPGGKSTIILDTLQGQGFLLANEIDPKRQRILQENLMKWGHANYATTSVSIDRFHDTARFDLILVDAPCSGEGMFRKDAFAQKQWNEKLVAQCAYTQRSILDDATPLLNEGGWLIYATCTMNPQENEAQIIRLLDSGDYELATPSLPFKEHVVTIDHQGRSLGHYLLPGISTGEGLFIAVLRKVSSTPSLRIKKRKKQSSNGSANTVSLEELEAFGIRTAVDDVGVAFGDAVHLVCQFELIRGLSTPLRMIGQPAFTKKGKNLIPEHGLAMLELAPATIALNHEEAIAYFRKEVLSLNAEIKHGWHVVSFEGRHLGWIKAMQGRTNNYYPGWLRLRM